MGSVRRGRKAEPVRDKVLPSPQAGKQVIKDTNMKSRGALGELQNGEKWGIKSELRERGKKIMKKGLSKET